MLLGGLLGDALTFPAFPAFPTFPTFPSRCDFEADVIGGKQLLCSATANGLSNCRNRVGAPP